MSEARHDKIGKTSVVIYHNPRCSKSREALELLRSQGVEPTVVEYLKDPPSVDELRGIAKQLGIRPRDLVRTKEDVFAGLQLSLDDDEAVLQALAAHPVLIERPIAVADGRAAIGRPPVNVLELFK